MSTKVSRPKSVPKTVPFSTWWLALWAITASALLTSLFFLPFRWWLLATVLLFGTMEGVGLHTGAPYPPLTDVIRRYLPAWAAFPTIYALLVWAGARWFHWSHPLDVGVLAGLGGWLTIHFYEAYSSSNTPTPPSRPLSPHMGSVAACLVCGRVRNVRG